MKIPKTKFFVLTVLILLNLSLYVIAYAQAPVSTPSVTPISPQIQNQEDPQVVALRAQLELMRQYDQRLLGAVYWSLGSMLTVVIVVVGVGWYTNFKIYERDKTALTNELRESLRTEALKEARDAANKAVKKLATDLKKTQYDLLKIEAGKWEADSVHDNALSTHLEMLKVATEIEYDFWVSRTLESMQRVLKARLNRKNELAKAEINYSLDVKTIKAISDILDELPKGYAGVADNIRQLLQQNS